MTESGEKWSDLTTSEDKNGHKNGHDGNHKTSKMNVPKFPAPIVEEVYKAIKLNRKAKYSWLQDNLGVSEATIKRAIADL